MDSAHVLTALAVAALVLSGLVTAAEAALLSVSRSSLERSLDCSDGRARRLLALHEDPRRTLAALSLGRLVTEMTTAVSLTLLVTQRFAVWWHGLAVSIGLLVVVSFLVVSVSPRTIGRRRPEQVLTRLTGVAAGARVLFGPLAGALIHIGSAITPGGRVSGGPYATEAELRQFADRATDHYSLQHEEREMIRGVFDLGDTLIRELMVPRTDMVTVSGDATATAALRLFMRSGFSRLPVVGENVDDLLGLLYLKDVTKAIHNPWDPKGAAPVRELMRPAVFIPEFLAADDVLRSMQSDQVHAAIVIDEYGGVSGMVTIEDILEEIVGEIADEHDRAEPTVEDLGDGRYRVPSAESVSETGELLGLRIEDEDVDTVGGLLAKALGKVPVPGSSGDALGLHLVADRTAGRRRRLTTLIVSRAVPQEDQ